MYELRITPRDNHFVIECVANNGSVLWEQVWDTPVRAFLELCSWITACPNTYRSLS
jgi:hypothetical protein